MKSGKFQQRDEIIIQNEMEITEIKLTVTKIRNAINRLISRFHKAKEIFSKLKNMSIEIIYTEPQRIK